jgi:multiple sugar transport system ATP-binding protein
MASVSITNITKTFPDGTKAVDDVSLEIADGSFTVLVGPSGCGKTTLLRIVAGLESAEEGAIAIGGDDVTRRPGRDRDVAMVFQSYALYPHLSVYENMAFSLRVRKTARKEIDRRVNDAAELLDLTAQLQRKPRQLSGGQRQRVAIGRAIVREPRVFLMDEPLSNLDAKLRVQMRAELARIQREVGITTIYVTHDQTEALTLADRAAILRDGRLQQHGGPRELFEEPSNAFVAGFIGSPQMNLIRGRVERSDHGLQVRLGSQVLELGSGPLEAALAGHRERELLVGLRPEDLDACSPGDEAPGLDVTVDLVEWIGREAYVHFGVDAGTLVVQDDGSAGHDTLVAGSTGVGAAVTRSRCIAVLRGVGALRPGDRLRLRVDPGDLYFFDADSYERIGADAGRAHHHVEGRLNHA